MKTRIKAFFVVALIVAIGVMPLVTNVVSAETIRAAGVEYCPFMCDVQKDGQEGFVIELSKAVFKKAGYEYIVQYFPFARALDSVVNGDYDALALCNKADVPEGGLIFPDVPTAMLIHTFAVRKDDTWTYTGVESLKGITVGSVIGYTWGGDKLLDQYMAVTGSPAVQRIGGEEDLVQRNLKKLMEGRIDAYLEEVTLLSQTVKQMGIEDKIRFEARVAPTPHFIGFTPGKKESEAYAKIFSDGMRALRTSGELAEILAKYGMQDWEK